MAESHETYRVRAPHFTAGIIVAPNSERTITDAAPILKYAIGRSFVWFRSYAGSKRWTIEGPLPRISTEGQR